MVIMPCITVTLMIKHSQVNIGGVLYHDCPFVFVQELYEGPGELIEKMKSLSVTHESVSVGEQWKF